MKRHTIQPKLRFQVFSRDDFTCQYCGRTPEQDDVVLHVDHTVSVKDGGTNDIANLITSCFDCNIGKGALSVLKRTRTEQDVQEELDLARERLAQIKALNKKKGSLKKIREKISTQETSWSRDLTNQDLADGVYREIQKILKKGVYTKEVLSQALEITYNRHKVNCFETETSFLSYLQGVARNLSLTPEQQQIILLYNQEVFRNDKMYQHTRKMILEYSDFGVEFHNSVVERVRRTLANKHGETFLTREVVLDYYPNTSFTVYKSGVGLQLLVCDTIAVCLEGLDEMF